MMNPLTPEQRRAVTVFEDSYHQALTSAIRLADLSMDHITVCDSRVFIRGKVCRKNLPHELHWVWHQSKSKETVITRVGEIILTKLSPRKLAGVEQCPSYKLWICEILNSVTPLFFIWCEKGKPDIFSPPPMIKPKRTSPRREGGDPIAIEDLAFLRDFIDPTLARQFGWIRGEPTYASL
mmetsp:Transcript_51/g.79  ORF Transcript_51/g.79 Transcript_51/m.79 type:complete len:180 (+) Transcript_51:233-772(+)